jgi:hypothetical protein
MARDGGGGRVEGGDRSREIEWNACVQTQGRVRKEHLDVFGVSKGMWSHGSRSCHAGSARGSTAERGQQQCDVGNAGASQHRVGRAAARQGSDAWDHRKQEVALELLRRRAAVKHGSGKRRTTWRGEEEPARGREAAGQRLGRRVDGRRAALGRGGAQHMTGQSCGSARQRNRGEGKRGRRRRTQMQFAENTGTLL